MKIVNNQFWRLEPDHGTDLARIPASTVLTSPAELPVKVQPLDGIVLGAWNPDTGQARVHALGIVRKIGQAPGSGVVLGDPSWGLGAECW